MAEIELSALARQCLRRHLPDQAIMARGATAWAARRNAASPEIRWYFTTTDARTKLQRLYSTFDD